MKKQLKNKLIDIINDQTLLKNRNIFGHADLIKGLPMSKPITNEQKSEIFSFWDKYLDNKYKKYFDIRWFDIYNKTNVDNHDLKHYIPDSYYYAAVDFFLSKTRPCNIVDDKNFYDLYFPNVLQPKTIVRKLDGEIMNSKYEIISLSSALDMCNENGTVLIKPSIHSAFGHGIEIWDSKKSDKKELEIILNKNNSVIVQEVITQHDMLAKLNNSCVNTLRMVTLLMNSKIHLVSAVVILGKEGAITNHLHQGGIVCGILPSGKLRSTAFDGQLNSFTVHPNGTIFSEISIPNYDKCIDFVKSLAPRFSEFSKLISWDVTIDKQGNPLLIETNLTQGGLTQIANGPVFGDMTEEVLDYVAHKHEIFMKQDKSLIL